jgi:hypothetical protein
MVLLLILNEQSQVEVVTVNWWNLKNSIMITTEWVKFNFGSGHLVLVYVI